MNPTALIENGRLGQLITLGVEQHPDRERVDRFIREGAQFTVKSDGRTLDVGLTFTPESPELARWRAEMAGAEVVDQTEDEGTSMSVIHCPVSTLDTPNQG